jgi:hypothetical protein
LADSVTENVKTVALLRCRESAETMDAELPTVRGETENIVRKLTELEDQAMKRLFAE